MLKVYNYAYWQLDLYKKLAKVHSNLTRSEIAKMLAIGAFVERINKIITEIEVKNDKENECLIVDISFND